MILLSMTVSIHADDTDLTFDLRSLTNTDWNRSYANVVTDLSASFGGMQELGDDYFALQSSQKYSSSNAARWKCYLENLDKHTYTWELDVLVTEGAVANIGFSTYSVFVMTDKKINGTKQGASLENSEVSNKPNQWRKVAISYDADKRQMQSYVDGHQVGVVAAFDFENLKYIAFSMDVGLSEVGSMIIYDNAIMYNEPYNPLKHLNADPQISLKDDSDGLNIMGSDIVYDENLIFDVSSIVSSIDAGDNRVAIYKDSTCAEPASGKLLGTECIVVEGSNGMYSYYCLKKASLSVYDNNVEFVYDSSKVGARAKFINTSSNDKTIVMIMVLKDENGIIQKLAASSELTIPAGSENPEDGIVEITPIVSNGYTAEVFFIESWSGRQRLFDDIYTAQ